MSLRETYTRSYSSFAGTDIVATITMPPAYGGSSYVLGELQTISYSTHRDAAPVLRLGQAGAAGFTSGYRTIGGSMIFTVFNHNLVYVLRELMLQGDKIRLDNVLPVVDTDLGSPWLKTGGWQRGANTWNRSGVADSNRLNSLSQTAILMDELPPFDVNIIMHNEYGNASVLSLSGIIIVDEGQVMSIEDLLVENTYSFLARSIVPLRPYEVEKYGRA